MRCNIPAAVGPTTANEVASDLKTRSGLQTAPFKTSLANIVQSRSTKNRSLLDFSLAQDYRITADYLFLFSVRKVAYLDTN